MDRKRRHIPFWTLACIVVCAVSVGAVIYIMANGVGLQDSLDFGAGAYYYADIPEFDKYLAWDAYSETLPFWVYLVIFLVWWIAVYRIWTAVDRHGKRK